MAEPRRVHAAPNSAVLYVYDGDKEIPQVEPSPDSLVVVLPSTLDTDLKRELEAFFIDAAKQLGLRSFKSKTV